MDASYLANTGWLATMALLLFFMHAGFGFYEAGMCHKKNTVDTLSHNLMILAISVPVFWLFGAALMLGQGNAFMGLSGFAPDLMRHSHDNAIFPALAKHHVPLAVAFAFVLFFADTPATLITGTGAERIRYTAVIVLTILITGVIFPIVGHWVFGGGWLAKLATPVFDPGSGFVQLCGGCCAMAVSIMLGPRHEEFQRKRKEQAHTEKPVPVSSMPLVFLGGFILWMGFFAFNTGLALHLSRSVGLVIVNTALAGSLGCVTAMGTMCLLTGNASLRATIVGMLTANVAITSAAGVIAPWAAAVIGAVSGVATVFSMRLWVRLRMDDPTEYITMNVVGGVMGLIAVGVFASPQVVHYFGASPVPKPGVIYGGGAAQLVSELIAAGAIIGFALPLALLACTTLHLLGLLRVTEQEEDEGADKSTHGEKAYEDEDDPKP